MASGIVANNGKGYYNVITRKKGSFMRTQLTRIGNSRGVRIPKPLIEECGLKDEIELRATPQGLVISPRRQPRDGWSEAFAKEQAEKTDLILKDLPPNRFDREEWKW